MKQTIHTMTSRLIAADFTPLATTPARRIHGGINPSCHVMPEHASDRPRITALLDRCFGKNRSRKTVARLRKGCLPALSFVTLNDFDDVIGTIRLWTVDAGGVPALLLGPVAVAPEYQGKGLGDTIIRHALRVAETQGYQAVILVGDAPYYERFGFKRALAQNLSLPGPVDLDRFLGFEIVEGALAGAQGMVVATGAKKAAKQSTHKAA